VESEGYAGNFGFEWTIHRETQLDGASGESEASFRLKTGFKPDELKGKRMLDVGCGMGRFAEVASRWGATVYGVDLSMAVNSAFTNLGGRENVHIAQADVFKLPFAPATFDFIFSIGVLHHTPDTKTAFDQLPRLLRRGGKIAIWLYPLYDSVHSYSSDVWRKLSTRLPKRLLYSLAHLSVPLHYLYRMPRLGLLPRALFPASAHGRARWRVLDTYDWYSPRYQWKHTYEEVWPWFQAQGLTDIRVLGAPVSLQGTRPKESLPREVGPGGAGFRATRRRVRASHTNRSK
jgi:SAM-dependent methyltransferase